MNFEEFEESVGTDGVFHGFPDDSAEVVDDKAEGEEQSEHNGNTESTS